MTLWSLSPHSSNRFLGKAAECLSPQISEHAHSRPSVFLPIRAGGGFDGSRELADEVAVIAEAGFNGDGGDGLVGFDEHLAGFSDAEFSHVGGGSELKGFLEVALKTAG